MSPANIAKPIEILFGMWTLVGPRKHVLDGVLMPASEGAILRVKRGLPRTCSDMFRVNILSYSAGVSTGTMCMSIGVY